jgi:uncharacterized protein YbjT (DUF2867 family)
LPATGALNGATVDHLLDRMPTKSIVIAVRDPAKAQRIADHGVVVRCGDYSEPASLPSASKVPISCPWCRRTTLAPTP